MIEAEVLTGYVLEEVLAALLLDNGYRLLVHESQDTDALKKGPHGLLVRGRGASHQADALGELRFSIPFSLPVRLFAEAKFKGKAIGIADVRNALGLLNDVNERYAADGLQHFPFVRYHYRYALFSTSGFTSDAQEFALTHQISLIDLQGPAFAKLRDESAATARKLRRLAMSARLGSFPVKQARVALRKALGTWSLDREPDSDPEEEESGSVRRFLPEASLRNTALTLNRQLRGRRLLLGFPQGPFVLVLQPDDPEAFDEFLATSESPINVDIRFASNDSGATGEWVLLPENNSDLTVRFGVPPLLEAWLLTEHGVDVNRVEAVKKRLLPHITVFHHGDRLTQLSYQKVKPKKPADIVLRDDWSDLRVEFADPFHAYGGPNPTRPDPKFQMKTVAPPSFENYSDQNSLWEEWVIGEVAELFNHLAAARASWQAEVIREAAAKDAVVPVERVYEIAGRMGPGTLRSLTRKVKRVMDQMVVEGAVRPGITPPLRTLHLAGPKVSHYSVPKEFIKLLGHVAITQ